MSLALPGPLETIRTEDPITRINSQRRFAIMRGGSSTTYRPYGATSWNNTAFQFNLTTPNPGIILDRKVAIRTRVRSVLVGTTGGGNLYQTGYFAPRAKCLSSCMTTADITLNNTKTSINMSDVIHPLSRYNTGVGSRDGELSVGPQMLDQYQQYASGSLTNRNALAGYHDINKETPRGAFPIVVATFINTPTGATIEWDITEYIYLSPFMWGENDKAGFIGLQNMSYTFNFGNLARLVSYNMPAGYVMTSVTNTFVQQPVLLLKYVTPRTGSPIPSVAVYPYYNVHRYITTPGVAVATNASTTIIANNMQLHSIPTRMYMFARKQSNTLLATDSDTYFRIDGVSIDWNNFSGLLASATGQDLYRISRRNGLELSWTQWQGITQLSAGASTFHGTVGSVLCLTPGIDIALLPTEAPGMSGNYQLLINLTVTNVDQTTAITPEMVVIIVDAGTWTIVNNQCIVQIGIITPQDVVASQSKPAIDYDMIRDSYGGNFWSGVKDFFKGVYRGFTDVMKIAAPVIQKVVPLLAGLGQGGSMVTGGRRTRRRRRGGMLIGGKQVSNAYIKKMLRM